MQALTQVANDGAACMLSLALLDGLGTERLLRVPGLEAANHAQGTLRIEALVRIVVLRVGEGELDEILAPRDSEDCSGESENGGDLHVFKSANSLSIVFLEEWVRIVKW